MDKEYERTVISITDENGDKSTITLDKWTSDILHANYSNVHDVIQTAYNFVCKHNNDQNLELSRRQRGDYVRRLADRKAEKLNSVAFDMDAFECAFDKAIEKMQLHENEG